MSDLAQKFDVAQGSPEWHSLRKTKITATDACVIMGASHWKTLLQLYNEKISPEVNEFKNEKMQRGIELEPIARSLYCVHARVQVEPKVLVKEWAMASLDGLSEDGKHLVEIKCAGEKDHALALSLKVPEHYFPQLQHQMYVCNLEEMVYFSFDGLDGVSVKVKRDQAYIEKMIEKEREFYQCLINRTPPPSTEKDYAQREDDEWLECASEWKEVCEKMHALEKKEAELRQKLIFLSGESDTKGGGITLCQVERKGNIDYSKIPELKSVDLEKYRKPSSTSWRITSK